MAKRSKVEIRAKGPELVAWLESTDADLRDSVLGHHARAINRWKSGGLATVEAVDAVCVKSGLHLSMVPDEFWIPKPKNKSSKRYTPDQKAEAVARVNAGEPRAHVARSLECSSRAISHWLHEVSAEPTA